MTYDVFADEVFMAENRPNTSEVRLPGLVWSD